MKGFFGILNINSGDFLSATEKHLLTLAEQSEKTIFNNGTVFMNDFESSKTRSFSDNNLQYVGWSRLDTITELQEILNLKTSALEEEVILAAYQKWGSDCLKHFIGDFSFVIWDDQAKTLFLTKDQMGIRPLFYIEQKGLLYFGTTIPAIKKALLEQPDLNERYIAKELSN